MSEVDDFISKTREWTDEDSIKSYMDEASKIQSSGVEAVLAIADLDPNVDKLPSIGVLYHNKMVELYQLFQEKGLSFAHSLVVSSVAGYFHSLINEAVDSLSKYTNANKGKISTIRRAMGKSVGYKYLERYIEICKELENFSLEKDIDKAINRDLDQEMKNPWYIGGINSFVDGYNEQLEKLGLPNRIEYRKETFKKTPEEVEEKAKKSIQKQRDKLEKKAKTETDYELIAMMDEYLGTKKTFFEDENHNQK